MISKLWLPEIYELICFNAHGLCRECGPMRFNHTKSERKIKRGEELGFVNGGCAVQNSMQRHLSAYEEGAAETQGRTTH